MSRAKNLRERAELINHHEGPLGAYVDNFSDWLAAQGYAVSTIEYFVRLSRRPANVCATAMPPIWSVNKVCHRRH